MSVRVFASMSIGLFFASPAYAALAITVGGSCPGITDIGLTGATANGSTALVTGTAGGSTVLAAGPCAGTTVNVGGAVLRGIGNADATGARNLHPNLANGACASGAQWLDQTTCQVSPATTLTPACTQPVTTWGDVGPVAGPPFMPDPAFYGVWSEASNAAGLRQNFTLQDAAGNFDAPATLGVDFYDGAFNYVCSTVFDVGTATPDPGYTAVTIDPMGNITVNPVAPIDAVTVTLAGGLNTCGPIDPNGPLGMNLGGSSDLRVFSTGIPLSFAYNLKISGDMKNTIVPQLMGGLAEWNTDWAPFAIGASFFGVETDFSFTFDRTCALVAADPVTFAPVMLPKPKGALKEHQSDGATWIFAL